MALLVKLWLPASTWATQRPFSMGSWSLLKSDLCGSNSLLLLARPGNRGPRLSRGVRTEWVTTWSWS